LGPSTTEESLDQVHGVVGGDALPGEFLSRRHQAAGVIFGGAALLLTQQFTGVRQLIGLRCGLPGLHRLGDDLEDLDHVVAVIVVIGIRLIEDLAMVGQGGCHTLEELCQVHLFGSHLLVLCKRAQSALRVCSYNPPVQQRRTANGPIL